VTFTRNGHAETPDGMSMPLSQANRMMERLDQRQAIDREKTDYFGPLTNATEFRVEYVKVEMPGRYTGRQEIGTGEETSPITCSCIPKNIWPTKAGKTTLKATVIQSWLQIKRDYKVCAMSSYHTSTAIVP
jgi:hypothetical protein